MLYKEKNGDLFDAPQGYCLAHCIAGDFGMGAGIATQFNERFDMKNRLISQFKRVDSPSCIQIDNVFNLITKDISYLKPTYDSLLQSLIKMKEIMIEHQNKKLAIPQIGCGLDGLKWDIVRAIIKDVFQDTDIEIVVYIYEEENKFEISNRIDEMTTQQISIDDYSSQFDDNELHCITITNHPSLFCERDDRNDR